MAKVFALSGQPFDDTMNIRAKKGDKVVYWRPNNGYEHDKETCNRYLLIGETYTVDHTEVGGSHTSVYLQEVPDIPFNSVMFVDEREVTPNV